MAEDEKSLREKRELVRRVASQLRVTKVVATRSVKGTKGDTYLGFSAAWGTSQDDGGGSPGATAEEAEEAHSVTAMTLKEAQIAAVILGRTVDIQAYRNAAASGNITAAHCAAAVHSITQSYAQLLSEVLGDVAPPPPPK